MEEQQTQQHTISWTHLPLYRSLTEYILFMGVPRSCIIYNSGAAIFMILTLGLSYWYLLTLNVIVHFAFRYFSQDDAQFFDCFVVYTYKHDYYST